MGGQAQRMEPTRVVIGTRGSPLAVRQTEIVIEDLRARRPDLGVLVVHVRTPGDVIADRPVASIGDKGVFVRPLERALLAGEIDMAVHSLKDVPSDVETPDLVLSAFPGRADPRDVLISRAGRTLDDLPTGARVGTSSLRRRCLLASARPDLQVVPIRGNVGTRLAKLEDGEYDAVVLAAAGLLRLGLEDRITQYLPLDTFVPDPGQGILAVQTRRGVPAAELAATVDHPEVRTAALAERGVARGLGADCRSPVGAFASISGDRLVVHAIAARDGGGRLVDAKVQGRAIDASRLGEQLGRGLLERLYTEQ